MSPRARIASSTASPLSPGSIRSSTTRSVAIGVHDLDRRLTVADHRHDMAVALQVQPQQVTEAWFVLDDEDPGVRWHRPHASGRGMQES